MKQIFLFITFAFLPFVMIAQTYQMLVFNYEKSYFNENEFLPAERYFMLTGSIPQTIHFVELQLWNGHQKKGSNPLFIGHWKRGMQNEQATTYSLPVNYDLRPSSQYDIWIAFYRSMTSAEKDTLQAQLRRNIEDFVHHTYQTSASGRKLKLIKPQREVFNDLNKLVINRLKQYRTRTQLRFTAFSQQVQKKIEELEKIRVKRSKEDGGASQEKLLQQFIDLILTELSPFTNAEMYVIQDDKFIENYPTNKIGSPIALNFGYAALPLSFDSQDFNYTSAPYAGISLPLGRKAFAPFWHRMAISTGVFLPLMRDKDRHKIDAPFTKIPLYLALSYRPWRFIRIHAGATMLKSASSAVSIVGLDNPSINVRPFIGVSIELNFWTDFAK